MTEPITDPVLNQLINLAGELTALQALAQYAQNRGIRSDELHMNMALMDHSMEQLTELMSARIVELARRRALSAGRPESWDPLQ